MISREEILFIHRGSLKLYGGGDGIRDIGALKSALGRPDATFGGEDLYPTHIEKAAAIGESIILNHPFVDANKRTGFLAMLAPLNQSGLALTATNNEAYEFVVATASGQTEFDDIVAWIKERVVQKP